MTCLQKRYGELEEYRRTHDENGNEIKAMGEETQTDGVWAMGELVASADYVPEEMEEAENDYTNGRLDIFRSYIEQLNMTGHEGMGAVLKNGEIATHAHNIYLQVAYDHGILVGILFVFVGIGTFVSSCIYYKKKKDIITYAALPAVVTAAFGAAGMVEWVFHLSHPCGLVLMMVIAPLVFHEGQKHE